MQTGRLASDRLAEPHDDAELVRADLEGEGEEGDHRSYADGDQEYERPGQSGPSGHDLLQLVLTALQQLLEVRLVVWPA
jgi:hypothetical protein